MRQASWTRAAGATTMHWATRFPIDRGQTIGGTERRTNRSMIETLLATRVWVWGVPFAPLTLEETVSAVSRLIREGRPCFFITANTHYAMLTEELADLRAIN